MQTVLRTEPDRDTVVMFGTVHVIYGVVLRSRSGHRYSRLSECLVCYRSDSYIFRRLVDIPGDLISNHMIRFPAFDLEVAPVASHDRPASARRCSNEGQISTTVPRGEFRAIGQRPATRRFDRNRCAISRRTARDDSADRFVPGRRVSHTLVDLPASIAFSTIALASGVSGALFFSPFFLLVVGPNRPRRSVLDS